MASAGRPCGHPSSNSGQLRFIHMGVGSGSKKACMVSSALRLSILWCPPSSMNKGSHKAHTNSSSRETDSTLGWDELENHTTGGMETGERREQMHPFVHAISHSFLTSLPIVPLLWLQSMFCTGAKVTFLKCRSDWVRLLPKILGGSCCSQNKTQIPCLGLQGALSSSVHHSHLFPPLLQQHIA